MCARSFQQWVGQAMKDLQAHEILALSDKSPGSARTARWGRLAALSRKCPASLACRTTYNSTRRSRSALPMTDTELNVIAALATIGLRRIWKAGYSTPAARGTPRAL